MNCERCFTEILREIGSGLLLPSYLKQVGRFLAARILMRSTYLREVCQQYAEERMMRGGL